MEARFQCLVFSSQREITYNLFLFLLKPET